MFQHTCVVCLLTYKPCFAGELPKELGQLANLKVFDVSVNSIGGELYVPAYMRCIFLADILTFFHRRTAQGARQARQFDQAPAERQPIPRQVVCPVLHAQFGHAHDRVLACVLHSDGRREDGTQSETSQD